MNIRQEDVLNIPNTMSAIGCALAIHGSMRADTKLGVAEAAVGRLVDLVDGRVARSLGQESDFGAGVDATLDKIAGLSIVMNEWGKGLAPKTALSAILIQNTVNGIATLAAIKKHPEESFKPTTEGKLAMATQNAALALYPAARLLKDRMPRTSSVVRYLGHAATIVGVGYFGRLSTKQYIQRARTR